MDFSKIGTAAAESEDMTQNATFVREVPRAGVALLRFREYVELGRHESSNPTYKPSLKAILTFELNHPDHMIEIDGVKVPQTIQVRLNKGSTAKSGFRKLFNVMNSAYDNKYVHFAQMIGLPFLGEVFHNVVKPGTPEATTYANLDKDGAYSLKAPVQVDALTNTQTPIPVPEMHGEGKVFLWENESMSDEDIKEMWESIYIEGTREIEDPKTKEKKEVSKNWIQETIMKNIEWEGSTTQALIEEHVDLEEGKVDAVAQEANSNLDALAGAASAEPTADSLPSMDD